METTSQNREDEESDQVEAPMAATPADVEHCWICNRDELEVRRFVLKGFLSSEKKTNLRTPLASLVEDLGEILQPVMIDFEKMKMDVPVCVVCRNIGYSLSVSGVTLDLENLEEQSNLRKAVAGHIAYALSSVITELRELKKKIGLSPSD